jgi:hypothetical protein
MKKYFLVSVLFSLIFAPKVFAASPSPVPTSMKANFMQIDRFRSDIYKQITLIRTDTQKEIDRLSLKSKVKSTTQAKPLDKTELPIAYIKLFLLSIVSFIFSTAAVFYVFCALLLFIILRYFYRKIRNR